MGIGGKLNTHVLSRKYYFAVITAVFGTSFLYGHGNGVLEGIEQAGKLLTLFNLNERYGYSFSNSISNNDMEEYNKIFSVIWAGIASIYLIGATIGAFIAPFIADRVGRKVGLIYNGSFVIIGSLFGGLSKPLNSFELLFVSRFFSGLSVGVLVPIVTMYISEISPKEIRGAVIAVHQFAITFGIFTAQVLNIPAIFRNVSYWHISLTIPAMITVVFISIFIFFPDSPRHIFFKNNDRIGAMQALIQFRKSKEMCEQEISEMEDEIKNTSMTEISWIELLTRKSLSKPLTIVFVSLVLVQFTGINAVFSFAGSIYAQAGIKPWAVAYVVIGTGAVNCIATIIAIPLIEKYGRRFLLLWPTLIIIVSLIMEVISLVHIIPSMSIISIYIFIIAFAVSYGIVPQAIMVEYFTQDVRSKAASGGVLIGNFSNFVVFWIFRPTLSNNYVKNYILLVFAAVCTGGFVFLFLFMPETKDKTYSENSIALSNWNTVFQKQKLTTTQ